MSVTVVTPPAEEPVSRAEAKLHMHVDGTDEDTLIDSLIVAVRRYAEGFTARTFVTTTFDLFLDAFPTEDNGTIFVPGPPLSSVTTVKYIDTAGVQQTETTPSSIYDVDTDREPGRIALAYNQSWPSTRTDIQAVEIQYVAGYGAAAAVLDDIKAAILLGVADLFEHREAQVESRLQENPAFKRLLWMHRILEFA